MQCVVYKKGRQMRELMSAVVSKFIPESEYIFNLFFVSLAILITSGKIIMFADLKKYYIT